VRLRPRHRALPTSLVLLGAYCLWLGGTGALIHSTGLLDFGALTPPLGLVAAGTVLGWLLVPFPRVRALAAVVVGVTVAGYLAIVVGDALASDSVAPTRNAYLVAAGGVLVAAGGSIRLRWE
jgi:hypothetical protein